jgi:hypothetical protein
MLELPRPWRPLLRAVALLAAALLAFRSGGGVAVGIVALWALLDALMVLAAACRRYDAERPWALPFFEGVIQVTLAVFVWVWWTASPSMLADGLALLVAIVSLGVLGVGVYGLWTGNPEGRVPAAAIGALVLVVAVMGSGRSTAEFGVAFTAAMVAFIVACGHRSFELARRRPGDIRQLLVPNAWSASLVVGVVLVGALTGFGVQL